MEKTVSVIIPALNEEEHIQAAVVSVLDALKGTVDDYELLLFNDGSSDKTGEIFDELAKVNPRIKTVHHKTNQGLGCIAREAYQMASKNYILWSSGDNSINPDSFQSILRSIGQADIIVGYMENDHVRSSQRRFFSGLFTVFMNMLFCLRLKYYNGPAAYPVALVKRLNIVSSRYDHFAETLIRAIKLKYTYKEIPFRHNAKNDRKSKAFSLKNFLSGIRMIAVLLTDIYIRRKPQG